jgi:hypothetical protein
MRKVEVEEEVELLARTLLKVRSEEEGGFLRQTLR